MFRPAMRIRADYDRAFAVVRDVIHEWDPYALIGGGAPPDEWDGEIASLVAQIPRIKSQNDAADAVSRVFSSAFQPEGFSPADCAEVGRRLYSSLADSGLLARARPAD
jgi:Domain of unknown function (DUF1871)